MEPYKAACGQKGSPNKLVLVVTHASNKRESCISSNKMPVLSQFISYVDGNHHLVQVYDKPGGFLIKVEGSTVFFIAQLGEKIVALDTSIQLNQFEYEILFGPVLVLALALRSVWSLHASAVMHNGKVVIFLGDSGQGKSTLAAFLVDSGWKLVSDDILPVSTIIGGFLAWPQFPQLKLSPNSQPGPNLPEKLPTGKIILLESSNKMTTPKLGLLSMVEAVKTLIAHTIGTRLFNPDLLGKHLEFCSHSAEKVPIYRLTYPHRNEALPIIKELLESLC
jgi:hypothetical protein